MLSVRLPWAALVLLGSAVVGVVVHELAHAAALRAAGVPCTVTLFPGGDGRDWFRSGVGGPLAKATPTRVPETLSPWQVRVAAMMPLCLATPFALLAAGVVSPAVVGGPTLELVAVGLLGCAIPSPRDFSVLWYPRRAMALSRGSESEG